MPGSLPLENRVEEEPKGALLADFGLPPAREAAVSGGTRPVRLSSGIAARELILLGERPPGEAREEAGVLRREPDVPFIVLECQREIDPRDAIWHGEFADLDLSKMSVNTDTNEVEAKRLRRQDEFNAGWVLEKLIQDLTDA